MSRERIGLLGSKSSGMLDDIKFGFGGDQGDIVGGSQDIMFHWDSVESRLAVTGKSGGEEVYFDDVRISIAGITSGNILYMHYDNICTDGIHLRCTASHAMIYINPRGEVEVDYGILMNMGDLLTMAAGIYVLNYKTGSLAAMKIALGGSGTFEDGIRIENGVVNAGITNGIQFSSLKDQGIKYAFGFDGIVGQSGAKLGAACNTDGVDSDAAIKIQINDQPYFIPVFTAANTDGAW